MELARDYLGWACSTGGATAERCQRRNSSLSCDAPFVDWSSAMIVEHEWKACDRGSSKLVAERPAFAVTLRITTGERAAGLLPA